ARRRHSYEDRHTHPRPRRHHRLGRTHRRHLHRRRVQRPVVERARVLLRRVGAHPHHLTRPRRETQRRPRRIRGHPPQPRPQYRLLDRDPWRCRALDYHQHLRRTSPRRRHLLAPPRTSPHPRAHPRCIRHPHRGARLGHATSH